MNEIPAWSISFSVFGMNWHQLGEHRGLSVAGEQAYTRHLSKTAHETFTRVVGKGMKALNVDVEDRTISEANVEMLSSAWAEKRAQPIRTITESMSLILGHAIFEQAIKELSEISIDLMPNTLVEAKHGNKQVTLSQACAGPHDAIRSLIKHKIQRDMTLKERIALTFDVCATVDPEKSKAIREMYKPDLNLVEAIDGRRQAVMHRVALDPDYTFDSDEETLELVARGCFHLVANCLCDESIGILELEVSAEGELALSSGITKLRTDFSQVFS